MNSLKWKILKLLLCLHCAGTFLVVAISPQIQTNIFKGVPDNWATNIDIDPFVKIGQKFYYIESRHEVNWYEAAHECRRRNANLASIESMAELDELQKYFISNSWKMGFWTSGNDLATEGLFHWLGTGNPIGNIRWTAGQPDNYLQVENCVHLEHESNQYSFNDWSCTSKSNYICEAKTPTTVALTLW